METLLSFMPNYIQTASFFVHGHIETHNQKELFTFSSCQQCQVVCELDAFRLTIFIPQTNCPYIRDLNLIQARLFLLFKGPRGGSLGTPLMISGTIKASPMKLCTVIVLLEAYQNTKRNFQKYDL